MGVFTRQAVVIDAGTPAANHVTGKLILVDEDGDPVALSPTDWSQITNMPAVIAAGATEAAAQAAIGIDSATTTTEGLVLQAEAQADSTATDAAGLVVDFNALLAKLRAAGVLAT